MAGKIKHDLTGMKFGRLTVLERDLDNKAKGVHWKCVCDCGNFTSTSTTALMKGLSKSCGCLHKEKVSQKSKKHGMHKTRIYKMWQNLKARCNCPSSNKFYNYGGRGIKACDEWQDDFMAFYEWAMKKGYSDNLTIDRIDSNGDYCPENCRFATYSQQSDNRRNTRTYTLNGETKTLKEWANITGLSLRMISARWERGWSAERALTTKNIKDNGFNFGEYIKNWKKK